MYDAGMTLVSESPPNKVRKTLTLDTDLVDTFSADDPASLSAAVNAVLRAEQHRRARAASVRQLADDLDALYGPVDEEAVAVAAAMLV
jgi:hypothetical protein